MRIVVDYPPIYDRIAKAFPLRGREIFAFSDTIYNPGGYDIPLWLVAHEEVHQKQQGDDAEGWWDRYLVDTEFRYEMEFEAHQQEYRSYCKHVKDRNARVKYLNLVAGKLAAPLYGSVVSVREAKRRIEHD
jgi:hypothetical protein